MKRIIPLLIIFFPFLESCYKEKRPAVNNIITELYSTSKTWPADGATQVPITADIPGNTVPGDYSLTFFSTLGLFYDSQKSTTTASTQEPLPDSSYRSATVYLVAPADTGIAVVTVTSQDISRTLKVHFVPALPQSVKLSTSTQFLTSAVTSEATLTLALIRANGTATMGQSVQISAVDMLGQPIGDFRNGNQVLSDKTGNATFYFSANQSTYLGKVKITAYLTSQPTLSDNLTITITN